MLSVCTAVSFLFLGFSSFRVLSHCRLVCYFLALSLFPTALVASIFPGLKAASFDSPLALSLFALFSAVWHWAGTNWPRRSLSLSLSVSCSRSTVRLRLQASSERTQECSSCSSRLGRRFRVLADSRFQLPTPSPPTMTLA